MIAASPLSVITQAAQWLRGGQRVVLVTLTGFEVSTPRAIGSLMVVGEDGQSHGSLSSGCVEQAIIAEALDVLRAGPGEVRGHRRRYGVGSPFLDIRLPCGGGMDLLFTPLADPGAVGAALDGLQSRQAVALRMGTDGASLAREGSHRAGWSDEETFILPLIPALRLQIFGQGEELLALARLAQSYGALVTAFSPQENDLRALASEGVTPVLLESLRRLPPIKSDAWSAIIFLFHERDWEEALLPATLAAPAFYHGAVGSARTHAGRLRRLSEQGVEAQAIARLRGGIGLIPATRDPATLALSILAEVAGAYAALPRCVEASPALDMA